MAHLPLTKLKTTLSGGSPVITNIYKYGTTYDWETLKCQQSAVQRVLDARHPIPTNNANWTGHGSPASPQAENFELLASKCLRKPVFEVFPSLKYLKIFACGEQQLFWTYKQTYIENRKSDQSNHGPPRGGGGSQPEVLAKRPLRAIFVAKYPYVSKPNSVVT